ncbi:DinB family protein [Pseudonocardia nantongensis]|uniref:DinB family protein n=1 Tax=Pseudonocardia nantongensis TaxID=1181885 RepID=UPI00397A94C0
MTDLIRWQFDLTWALCEYHLDRLVDDDLTWLPAPLHWTLHPGPDGGWTPDFAETEPDPVPAPTGAWLGWHLLWWWGTALDELTGRRRRDRTDVVWPGSAAGLVTALHELAGRWREALDAVDPDRPVTFPWPTGHTAGHLTAWANAELMKNAAELGHLRFLRAAGAGRP